MKKSEIRFELEKLGVVYTDSQYNKLSAVAMQNKLNEVKGGNNMSTTNINLAQLMQECTAKFSKQVITEVKAVAPIVNAHTTEESNRIIEELSKQVKELADKINNQQSVASTGVNPNQSSTQYIIEAANLKPIGTMITKTGATINSFGKCACCGCDIPQARTVAYSKQYFGKIVCYNCQQKEKKAGNKKQAPAKTNTFVPDKPADTDKAPVSDGMVHKKCMCCNKDIPFKTVSALAKWTADLQAKGYMPIVCPNCIKDGKGKKDNGEATNNNVADQVSAKEPELTPDYSFDSAKDSNLNGQLPPPPSAPMAPPVVEPKTESETKVPQTLENMTQEEMLAAMGFSPAVGNAAF